ncbi:ATP-binding protein [Aquabacterium sp. A7-Y]|uniref:ATP-binding protein n=1 Tax=Aquabacterium sp. A7-Y TaxID=1349605 RepID=UPI00223DA34E|nr:ATP-binding protein [Aquabacterium sp. A7-Y]MCW7538362.1 ATP-binding protein [Aquabacterium sp. A7-Y]
MVAGTVSRLNGPEHRDARSAAQPRPPSPSGLSTRVRIGLGFGTLALVLFLLVGWASGVSARRQVSADAGESLAELSRHLSSTLEADMAERYREIQNIANLVHLQGSRLDARQWRAVLEQLQLSHHHYAWIGVTDTRGIVLAATSGMLEGRDVSQRPWFVEGREGPYVGDVHDAVLLASLLPSTGKEPLRLVDVAAPIMQGDEVLGVLGAHLSWTWAEQLGNQVLAPIELARKAEVVVLNAKGELLLGPKGRPPVTLTRGQIERLSERRWGTETWSDGREYLSAAHFGPGRYDYPGLRWTVVVRQPLETAVAAAQRLQWQIWGFGVIGTLAFALSGWSLAGRLAAPLRKVARDAQLLSRHGDTPQDEAFSHNEVALLSRALGELVRQLRERERELVTLNETLEQRVEDRTEALERANADLQAFSRSVSDDLKGPLAAIGAAARMVTELNGVRLDERSQQMLSLMAAECDRLGELVDELLALSRVDYQPLQTQRFEMEVLVRAVVADVLSDADRATAVPGRWKVEVQPLPPVEGDAVLLRQVWQNLLTNAVKFTRGVREPQIEVGARTDAREHVFWVRDNGVGFEMRHADRLFTAFQRLHSAIEFPGSGVGLSIVKRIVDRHEGRVWAEGRPGEGATFYFALPRHPERERPRGA